MIYIYAFLFCGTICMLSQIILDNTKLTPGHVTSIFVVLGALLDIFGIYDKIVLYAGAGALVPITSFGHLLIHGAMTAADDQGDSGRIFAQGCAEGNGRPREAAGPEVGRLCAHPGG